MSATDTVKAHKPVPGSGRGLIARSSVFEKTRPNGAGAPQSAAERTAFRRKGTSSSRLARGVSLLEIVSAIGLSAGLAAFAVPAMTDLTAGDRLRNSGTDLIASILLARGEAMKRNDPVAISPMGTWDRGWTVSMVSNGEQLDARPPLARRVHVKLAPATIVYNGDGHLLLSTPVKLELSDTAARASARCITTDATGLPRLTVGSCS